MKEQQPQKKPFKGFVSYSSKDKDYLVPLVAGLKSHSSLSKFDHDFEDDRQLDMGKKWHEQIQEMIMECDYAILLISPDFFSSGYVKEHELTKFIEKSKKHGFLFFPVLIRVCNYKNSEEIAKIQFFPAKGEDYDKPEFKGKLLPYAELAEFMDNGVLKTNPKLDTYHLDLINHIDNALSLNLKDKPSKESRHNVCDFPDSLQNNNSDLEDFEYFVNRKKELDILKSDTSWQSNYILEAPSGYGKTFFIRKLSDELDNIQSASEKSILIYLDLKNLIENKNGFETFFYSQLNMTSQNSYIRDFINKIVNCAIALSKENKKLRLYVVFDHFEYILENEHKKAHQDLEKFIEKLIKDHSKRKKNEKYFLHIILSGRKVDMISVKFRIGRKYLNLSDFDEDVVINAIDISKNILKRKGKSIGVEKEDLREEDFYQTVIEISGNHPKVIVLLLKNECEPMGYDIDSIDNITKDKIILTNKYTFPIISEVISRMSSKITRKFNNIQISSFLQIMSVFRVFSDETLGYITENLTENDKIKENITEDYNLEFFSKHNVSSLFAVLQTTLLYRRINTRFFGDSIVRQLFFNYLKVNNKKLFKSLNQFAVDLYCTWIRQTLKSDIPNKDIAFELKELIYHKLVLISLHGNKTNISNIMEDVFQIEYDSHKSVFDIEWIKSNLDKELNNLWNKYSIT